MRLERRMATIVGGLLPAIVATAAMAQATARINIPAQSLAESLREVGSLTGTNVMFDPPLVEGRSAPALSGLLTSREAFERLLAGSHLQVRFLDDKTVMILMPSTSRNTDAGADSGTAADEAQAMRIAQEKSGPEIPLATQAEGHDANDEPTNEKGRPAGEVVVTGSRIRGVQPTSTVHTVTRQDIDASGYAQIGDVLRSLPETFAGGNNPGIAGGASAGGIANQNISNASTVNLRGLGSDATLTLLNGHRLASDAFYQSADISGIPLAAIDRVEVLTDGASALYGSDAIAGVANIILKTDYRGIESSARVGTATQGGGFEQLYSVLGGTAWGSGHVMLNGEYNRQESIRAYQRDFTETATPHTALLQPNDRKSLFLELGQALTDELSFSVEGLYHERDVGSYYNYGGYSEYSDSQDTHEYAVYPSLTYTPGSGWRVLLTGGYARARNHDYETGTGDYLYDGAYKNRSTYGELTVDGPLVTLPSGTVRLALGGGYREETYSDGSTTAAGDQGARNIRYAYAEALVPLVAPSPTRVGLHQLELSLAGRTEHYNVFGNTSNPKLGVRYVPWTGWTLRGSWGKSFKAPSLLQEYEEYLVYIDPVKYLGRPAETTNALVTWGGSRSLSPERSTSWTTSVEFAPAARPSLTLSATYFNINYQDRVVQPVANLGQALVNPIYSSFVTSNPSAAQQAQILQGARVTNYSDGPYDPSNITAIIQDRYYNASVQRASGLDVSIRDGLGLGGAGRLEVFANGSWLRLTQRTVLEAPEVGLSGTLFNPARSRARGGATWVLDGLSLTGTLNYIAGETDTGVSPRESIGSWTTLDANVTYRFMEAASYLKGMEVSGSVVNAFDRDPPYAHGAGVTYVGLYYDSTNTSPIGRFIALTLRKRW